MIDKVLQDKANKSFKHMKQQEERWEEEIKEMME